MNKIWMVDPPSGWKYGFPKKLDEDELKEMTFEQWLVKNGYPEEDAEFAAKYSRWWKYSEDEDGIF
jgi:hypothetical protein